MCYLEDPIGFIVRILFEAPARDNYQMFLFSEWKKFGVDQPFIVPNESIPATNVLSVIDDSKQISDKIGRICCIIEIC